MASEGLLNSVDFYMTINPFQFFGNDFVDNKHFELNSELLSLVM